MEKREERQIEKDLCEEERLEGVTVRVWWEERKRKDKREKVREFIVRESRCQIFFVSRDYKGYGKR